MPAEEESELSRPLAELPAAIAPLSMQPVPLGRFRRAAALGTLQAKIAAAYLFHWLRGWFKSADENRRLLAETHWRTAVRLLNSMNYLRGLVMKVGQTLANFPDIAPAAFVETLERLHFDAPPMHWSLLRELVRAELGDDPENLFASFDTRAFAAASLGQVHRARLHSGEEVAVKIQYPGIARTIQADFRNLFLFMLPGAARQGLGKHERSVRRFADAAGTRNRLPALRPPISKRPAGCFAIPTGIVVPRSLPQFSTDRVLTMERLEGVHLREFMARDPSQAERNEVARKMVRAWYRMYYAGKMFYPDLHPGNFIVMDDGRAGMIDFGLSCRSTARSGNWPQDGSAADDRPLRGPRRGRQGVGRHPRRRAGPAAAQRAVCRMVLATRVRIVGEFDFGDEADFRRGIDLFTELVRRRYSRSRPSTPTIARGNFCIAGDPLPSQSTRRFSPDRRRGGPRDWLGPERLRAVALLGAFASLLELRFEFRVIRLGFDQLFIKRNRLLELFLFQIGIGQSGGASVCAREFLDHSLPKLNRPGVVSLGFQHSRQTVHCPSRLRIGGDRFLKKRFGLIKIAADQVIPTNAV